MKFTTFKAGKFLVLPYYDVPVRVTFCLLTIKLISFTYTTGMLSIGFYPSLGAILVVLAYGHVIADRSRKIAYLYLTNLFFTILFFCNSVYFGYFRDFPSVAYVSQLWQLQYVAGSVTRAIRLELLYFADLVVLPILLPYLDTGCEVPRSDRIKSFFVFVLLSFCFNCNALSYVAGSSDNPFKSVISRQFLANYMGIVNYQIWDIYHYFAPTVRKIIVSKVELNQVDKRKHLNRMNSGFNPLSGLCKGENLIVIDVESLQSFVIGRKFHGREITPNLNGLVRTGIYFDNIYDQTGAGSSSDATFLSNCSLYPSRLGAATFLFSHDHIDSLPSLLREKGYSTATLHAFKRSFWNYDIFEKAVGFDLQFYESAYIMDKKCGLGLCDRSFFTQSAAILANLRHPFYASLRNISTHAPFYGVSQEIDAFPLHELEGTEIGYYLRAVHYVDGTIGEFLKMLSKSDLRETTVIAIFGDHRAHLTGNSYDRINIQSREESSKIPLIINCPNKSRQIVIHTIGGLIDFAPTISNMLGIDSSDKFFLGNDLAGKKGNYVIFRNGDLISVNRLVNRAYATQELLLSDMVLEKNILAYVGGGSYGHR